MTEAPAQIEYATEAELVNEFNKLMREPSNVDAAVNYLYNSLIDEQILGVVFELHFALKTGVYNALEGIPEDSKQYNIVDLPDIDIFGTSSAKIAMVFTCPKCDQPVAAARFAPHLEKCMGMGRISSRIASRRIANSRDGGGNYFGTSLSDDEDDADWSGEKRRKKIQPLRTNGTKKNGKSS